MSIGLLVAPAAHGQSTIADGLRAGFLDEVAERDCERGILAKVDMIQFERLDGEPSALSSLLTRTIEDCWDSIAHSPHSWGITGLGRAVQKWHRHGDLDQAAEWSDRLWEILLQRREEMDTSALRQIALDYLATGEDDRADILLTAVLDRPRQPLPRGFPAEMAELMANDHVSMRIGLASLCLERGLPTCRERVRSEWTDRDQPPYSPPPRTREEIEQDIADEIARHQSAHANESVLSLPRLIHEHDGFLSRTAQDRLIDEIWAVIDRADGQWRWTGWNGFIRQLIYVDRCDRLAEFVPLSVYERADFEHTLRQVSPELLAVPRDDVAALAAAHCWPQSMDWPVDPRWPSAEERALAGAWAGFSFEMRWDPDRRIIYAHETREGVARRLVRAEREMAEFITAMLESFERDAHSPAIDPEIAEAEVDSYYALSAIRVYRAWGELSYLRDGHAAEARWALDLALPLLSRIRTTRREEAYAHLIVLADYADD